MDWIAITIAGAAGLFGCINWYILRPILFPPIFNTKSENFVSFLLSTFCSGAVLLVIGAIVWACAPTIYNLGLYNSIGIIAAFSVTALSPLIAKTLYIKSSALSYFG